MRLNGHSATPAHSSSSTINVPDAMMVAGLTEDEMLQMALEASMEPGQPSPPSPLRSTSVAAVPPEPVAGAPEVVRIQFKLPDQQRLVRRFLASDLVEVVYAYVEQQHSSNRPVEMRCGFPPQDLSDKRHMTIGEAQLANQSIQGRYL